MDLDGRAREKSTGLWDEMLLKAIEHFMQGPHNQWGGLRKIQATIGEYDELLTMVKKCLAQTILQGTVIGKRSRGRQKKRWEDNIKKLKRMDFASSTRAAENRTRWREVVAKSSWPSKVMGYAKIDLPYRSYDCIAKSWFQNKWNKQPIFWSYGFSTTSVFELYRKNSKNWDTLNYHLDCPTNGIVGFYSAILRSKDADRITNRVDTDQTAPRGAVWSGSALFAQTYLSQYFKLLR